jgi:uncharacterized hydrophobic protein (TIGR00271 family)
MRYLNITPERFAVVRNEIAEGSEPGLRFYILVAVSTLIASFGLISDSTAVIIGAMLVAPLMTPIFGISLALVRGDTGLFGRAARAEILGVAAAVSMGFILGLLLGDFDTTREMLSRTRPNLFDLFVAVLAGFAGAYALIDEKISPALPGVAIATAIVPPLANAGLCLALGEVQGGIGSFLLFFANFLSILIVASVLFILSGMAKRSGGRAKHADVARRFGLPVVAFVFITIFLGHALVQIYQERRITKLVNASLIDELSRMPAPILARVHHYTDRDQVNVVASVHTPRFLAPGEVSRIQEDLTRKIGKPASLIVHCILSNNVSAQGAVNHVVTPKLDGTFVVSSDNPVLNAISTAEQIIRDYLSGDKALSLIRAEYLTFGERKFLLAHMLGLRPMTTQEIAMLETRIRGAVGDDGIELAVTSLEKSLKTATGPVRYGWILGDQGTPEIRDRIQRIRGDLEAAFARYETFELVNINATRLDGELHFLLEIAGHDVFPPDELEVLQTRLVASYAEPVKLYAWSRIERVRGPDGLMSLENLNRYFQDRQKENLAGEIPLILEASSR